MTGNAHSRELGFKCGLKIESFLLQGRPCSPTHRVGMCPVVIHAGSVAANYPSGAARIRLDHRFSAQVTAKRPRFWGDAAAMHPKTSPEVAEHVLPAVPRPSAWEGGCRNLPRRPRVSLSSVCGRGFSNLPLRFCKEISRDLISAK